MVEEAVVALAIGVAEMEFPKGLVRLWIITNYPVFRAELQIPLSGGWHPGGG